MKNHKMAGVSCKKWIHVGWVYPKSSKDVKIILVQLKIFANGKKIQVFLFLLVNKQNVTKLLRKKNILNAH